MVVNNTSPTGARGYDPNLAGKYSARDNLGEATVGAVAGIGNIPGKNPSVKDNDAFKLLRYLSQPENYVDKLVDGFKKKDDDAPAASSVR